MMILKLKQQNTADSAELKFAVLLYCAWINEEQHLTICSVYDKTHPPNKLYTTIPNVIYNHLN